MENKIRAHVFVDGFVQGVFFRQNTFKKAKDMIDKNVLGELIYFNATTYVSQIFTKGVGWRFDKKTSGGGRTLWKCLFNLPAGKGKIKQKKRRLLNAPLSKSFTGSP